MPFAAWCREILAPERAHLYKDPWWGPCARQCDYIFDATDASGPQLVPTLYRFEVSESLRAWEGVQVQVQAQAQAQAQVQVQVQVQAQV